MRISDWSSDVCSSDLAVAAALARRELCGDAWNAIEREPESGSRPMVSPPAGRKSGARRAGALGDRLDRSAASGSAGDDHGSEEHTSELQSLMRISYAVFCLKTKTDTI